ncbi:secreted RxLR effector peptide protein, putative [Phytophthora infestans T30-4]|uniref:Secreted RxLR effector peptide protein, putative n=2 Tax=Phytophthora infestans TaxID=4787 RepID=D0NT27_PHYIT|nr:secreted RxLR effector peptide protein, putative [Phytophthora infestans T30-4]EEY64783.1 secreted RxLR effector peptide protein, putative [Phytophthora infestans T30-4]KAF4046420.1 hypothetical protein GN244_ATG01166 [Phytophthora infestans]KAF4133487.1 hypothetical protein GN958_ATG17339 [Phytophthora infestans]KAI9980156.1 hypothetical protein PInf_026633 [Phytophthora infestans]|eukprot:XP_002897710.1 secreted RxLR effector peptide protein, putative [Phytophthora infestans T30-4]
MRLSHVLLLAVTTFVSSTNAQAIEANAETRFLRLTMTDDAGDKERGAFYHKFDFSVLDDIFHGLPQQFKRMRDEPETLRNIFASWKSGMQSADDAVIYMKSQGLSNKAIKQFKAAYQAYLNH